ncbi:MAG TPA: hypothetical protein VJQ44_11350 [Gemmatimonadales bacterium]|nr:hypothetical protein [Gemmatimonadales bacterium]
MTEAQLKEAYQAHLARSRKDRASCPEPEAIQALVRREGDEATRLATLDHVMSCGECRTELDLLRTVEEAGVRSGTVSAPGRRRWMMPAALAATLLVAVGLGRLALRPSDDTLRSGDLARVELVAPGAEVPGGSPVSFAWHPVEGASRYRLEVLDEAGDLAIEAETHDTALTSDSAARLAPGSYQWWVIALSPGPGPRSELRRLRVIAR